jgi:eukaryotic-like serine/threonine-protein kinase
VDIQLRQLNISIILVLLISSCATATETPPPTPTPVPVTSTATQTPRPSLPRDAHTPAPIAAPTETPVGSKFDPVLDAKGVPMLPVPAGEFTMGGTTPADVQPPHKVKMDAFYIDEFEVTNALYQLCVAAGPCRPPLALSSGTIPDYYLDPQYDRYPVIYVDWDMADTFCTWRGAALPTEAQWEKAARGTDARTYPWGENIDCAFANYQNLANRKNCRNDVSQVGSYESGRSIYGLYDMAGNVWEWVNDWYGPYGDVLSVNPTGPKDGTLHVMRGGSYSAIPFNATTTFRTKGFSNYSADDTGFRCARHSKP